MFSDNGNTQNEINPCSGLILLTNKGKTMFSDNGNIQNEINQRHVPVTWARERACVYVFKQARKSL